MFKGETMGARTAFIAVIVVGIAIQVIVNPIAVMFGVPVHSLSLLDLVALSTPVTVYIFAKSYEKHIAARAQGGDQ
ncbi:hypothetical protein [Asticcacaulis sp. YBE204]|uniref:hypothetical protein n=1 Tax=Asticcacaulis sp. YBE204 TaxID=1282363 RepID=UPI0003C3BB6C|nr:hypothetical protein [Asticcacaulis sp. YBE204]ESQ78494.1 hypothetical protein AEYBE204_13145 [Asticcacaulis sp. YBE204]